MALIPSIEAFHPIMQDIRRDIHAHPELGYEECRTSDMIAAYLERWGITVHRGLGGTGVVGVVRGMRSTDHDARAIGLRADMDALPMQEANTFEHASRHEGRMHACGHDGHVAMLLGAAHYLSQHRDFAGTVYLVFQPAEETGAGARKMIEDGLFIQFPMDAVFGMHNWPGLELGQFGVTPGAMMASANLFEATIQGKGSHAAQPQHSIDPVMVAVHVAQAWQTIISRNLDPIAPAVLSLTQVHAGTAPNVIPDTVFLAGTVRTFTLEAIDLIEARMRDILTSTCAAFGAHAHFEFKRNYPPLLNHESETHRVIEVMRDLVSAENVDVRIPPTMGSEDFAFMLQEKPGCYVFIGNGDGLHREAGHGLGPCHLHNPSYDFNDGLLPLGASYWVRLVENFLAAE